MVCQRALHRHRSGLPPDLLIADGPTSALDVTVQEAHPRPPARCSPTRWAPAVLFITHDLGLAAERAQHYRDVQGSRSSNPDHPAKCSSTRSTRTPSDWWPLPRRWPPSASSPPGRGEDADALLDHHIAGESTLERASASSPVRPPDQGFKLPRKEGDVQAVDECPPSSVAPPLSTIVGRSGFGKSTVANMVLHLLKPTSGKGSMKVATPRSRPGICSVSPPHWPISRTLPGSLDPMYSIFPFPSRTAAHPTKIDSKWRANRGQGTAGRRSRCRFHRGPLRTKLPAAASAYRRKGRVWIRTSSWR